MIDVDDKVAALVQRERGDKVLPVAGSLPVAGDLVGVWVEGHKEELASVEKGKDFRVVFHFHLRS